MLGYNYYKLDDRRIDIHSKRLYQKLNTLNDLIRKLPADGLELNGIKMNPSSMLIYNRIWNDMYATTGGRLYNKITSMSKADRKLLMFNGEKVVELDFACCMPRALYHLSGIDMQEDIYILGTYSPEDRNIFKLALNILINCDQNQSAVYALNREVKNIVKSQGILKKVIKTHYPISKFFYSGVGLKLMTYESEIAINVLTELAKQMVVSSGIHDAFLVPASIADYAKELMSKYYKSILGVPYEPVIKIKEL